ncbi:unnamed protein product [Dovyalis caffra]|uniref:DAGKc domain-containing protein n=1 Tax=Dovyalis caffra TaxID=77055 RepID=A0AAV1SE85_9ROSI|nr:unnamed protein product [Dovyalis caffra]
MACCYQIALGGVTAAGAASSFSVKSKFKPLRVLKAEHLNPMASDLSPDPSVFHDGSSSSSFPRRDLVFIVNPRGANGRTGKEWKKLLPYLRSRLEKNCPYHAIDITREAIREGADAVVAVGGDGTLHEVVNGFFWAGKPVTNHDREVTRSTALGLIPLGTGSDFARTLGWLVGSTAIWINLMCSLSLASIRKNDPFEAIDRITKGMRSRMDVGVITGESEESHYFINVADIHLSAKAGYFASRYKRFGNLCYVIGALQAFMGHKNQDLRIKVNEGQWETCSQVTALCIGNAKYFGGGMKITPNADPSSGNFEVVILQDFKCVFSIEVEDISGSGSIYVQSDGEHLGFLPRKFCILPSAIEMIC